ncbi:hypothetical protein DIPPA_04877 [Diplonema papillatum]|nr:hypothetical protein DIPPA_04877 [Diplonema papillatum]
MERYENEFLVFYPTSSPAGGYKPTTGSGERGTHTSRAHNQAMEGKVGKRTRTAPRSANLNGFQEILDAMTKAMDGGTGLDWMNRHANEGMVFVVCPDINNPELDARSCGTELVLSAYNTAVTVRYEGIPAWDFEEEIRQLSARTFQVDWISTEAEGKRSERFFFSLTEGRVSFVQKSWPVGDPTNLHRKEAEAVRETIGSSTLSTPPCWHNSWDSVRGRVACSVLRCRECSCIWKIEARHLQDWRCCDFLRGCRLPQPCRRLHIHARKARSNDEPNQDKT